MAAHRVAENGLPRHVGGKIRGDDGGEFRRHIGIHAVMRHPRRLRRVDIKAGAAAQFPVVRHIGHARPTRARVRTDDNQPMFGGGLSVFALLHDIGMGAGEAGEIPQHRKPGALLMRRHEDGESHGALAGLAHMRVDALDAAMAFGEGTGFDAHGAAPVKPGLDRDCPCTYRGGLSKTSPGNRQTTR